MIWEEEKRQYITKLEGIVDGIDKILNLQGNSVVTPEMHLTLKKKREDASKLLDKLRKNEFEIAVVGLEKAGKSSFSNAFIELKALPTDEQRCTYTSTCIRYSDESKASVCFHTRQDFTTDFRDKLELLGVPDAHLYSPDNLTLEKYSQLFDECDDTKKQLYEDSLNQDIRDTIENWDELKKYVGRDTMEFSEQEIDDDFKKYITSPSRAIAVKDVVIYTRNFKSMENAVMYDVPGFNSPTQMHQEQTLAKMKSADAIIMVAKADEPSITGEVIKVFKKSDMDGELLSQKLFIFANKADRAENLEKNKSVIYDEWLQKRAIMPNTQASMDRIVFGSANAHLGDKAPHGQEARKKLEEQGLTDGIETLRDKLNVYYKTTRFEVLKKRVGKILNEIEALFADKKEQYATDGDQYTYSKEVVNLGMKIGDNLRESLRQKLAQLKNAINKEAREKKPLTPKIAESIRNTITIEKYHISKDEMDAKHIEIAGVGAAEEPQKIDAAFREKRFSQIYDDFSENILMNTSEKHGEECDKIICIFMDEMDVAKGSSNYEKLKNEIVSQFALQPKQENNFYQGLIERFARDLIEVQIKFAHGRDRLNKFTEEAANFLSMGVFYSASTTDASTGTDLDYTYSAPSDSPLWRRILYPEQKEEDRTPIIEEFKKLTGLEKLNDRIDGLLSNLIRANGEDSSKALLVKTFAGFMAKKIPAVAIASEAANLLEGLCGSVEDDTSSQLKDIIEGNRYQRDIAEKHREYTYETVAKEFDEDIEALQCVLTKAFIPAVSIDKAFSARESKLIEDIRDDIASEKFRDFISNNLSLIVPSQLEGITQSQAQLKLNAAVMNEIRAILDKITSN